MTRPLTQNAHHALVEMWGPWSPLPLDLALLTMVTVQASSCSASILSSSFFYEQIISLSNLQGVGN